MRRLLSVVGLGVAALIGFWAGQRCGRVQNEKITDTIFDTVTYRMPIAVDITVIRYERVKLPIRDTIRFSQYDTLKIDSVWVEVPISQKEYSDSVYHLWISGYKANLDSIQIRQRTVIPHVTTVKPKRWGIGPQISVGYCNGKFAPCVGIGVTYSIFSW